MPRMTNTFMLAGDSDPEEIIRSTPRGLYCANFGGGQVDITSGNFVFSASESYLIEDGHITRPVRGAMLTGNGPEALKYVSMVGHDLKLDEGIGICGKEGQSVPVGVGIPTVKIDRMTVGGTAGMIDPELASEAVRAGAGARRNRRRMHSGRRRRIFGAGAHARARNAEGRRIAARGTARSDWQARGLGPYLRPFERRVCGRWWNRRWPLAAISTEDPYADLPDPSELGSLAGDLAALLRRHPQLRHRRADSSRD